jgi:hypothetical protein
MTGSFARDGRSRLAAFGPRVFVQFYVETMALKITRSGLLDRRWAFS